jgi:hypothetical protein
MNYNIIEPQINQWQKVLSTNGQPVAKTIKQRASSGCIPPLGSPLQPADAGQQQLPRPVALCLNHTALLKRFENQHLAMCESRQVSPPQLAIW